MLSPKKTKFRKQQKGRIRGVASTIGIASAGRISAAALADDVQILGKRVTVLGDSMAFGHYRRGCAFQGRRRASRGHSGANGQEEERGKQHNPTTTPHTGSSRLVDLPRPQVPRSDRD